MSLVSAFHRRAKQAEISYAESTSLNLAYGIARQYSIPGPLTLQPRELYGYIVGLMESQDRTERIEDIASRTAEKLGSLGLATTLDLSTQTSHNISELVFPEFAIFFKVT